MHVHGGERLRDDDDVARHDVKIVIGVGGPQMRRLAGAIADGVMLNGKQSPEVTRRAILEIRDGAASAGRRREDVEIVKPLTIVLTRNKRDAIEAERPALAQYIAQQPHIAPLMEAEPQLVRRQETIRWPTTETAIQEAAQLIPPQMIERMGAYGDEDDVRARLREFTAVGADVLVWDSSSPAPARQILDFLAEGW